MRKILVSFLGLTLVMSLSSGLYGQTGNASLGGIVTDTTKALIPGVTITAKDINTGVVTTTTTNDTGSYNFPTLLPGSYQVTADLTGFKKAAADDVRLGVSTQGRLNFTLEIGSAGTQVDVSSSAQALLTESSASIGEVLSEDRIRALPLVGNNVLDLLEVLPGFRVSAFGSAFDTINGLGLNSINTTINGLSTMNTRYDAQTYGVDVFTPTVINPDLVGEIRLILSPVDAEYGRGNSQVQIQTKSGTNKYTGAVVWNIQNSALNANTWLNNHTGTIQNGTFVPNNNGWRNTHQVTASYGGPIVKSKTFFFVLYDQQLTNTREPTNINVMSDSARQGIYRYWTGWAPANASVALPASYPQTAASATYPSVNLDGSPLRPQFNPDGTPYTGFLACFSVFGNTKFDGTPFTQGDCPGGTALFNTNNASWDAFRPSPDRSGYYQKILALMPKANYFASGDGLNQAQYRYIRSRTGSNTTNAIVGAVNATGASGASSDQTNRKQINIKIDENLNQNHRFNVGMQYQFEDSADNVATWPVCDSSGTSCTTSPLNGFVRRRPQIWTVNGTSTLSSSLVNEARFGMQTSVVDSQNAFTSPNQDIANAAKSFLLTGGNSALTGAPYSVVVPPGVGNFAGGPLNVGAEIGNKSPLWSYGDTLSWTRGKHAFKFGAEVRLPRSNGYNIQAIPSVTLGNASTTATPNVFGSATAFATQLPGLLNAAATGSTAPRTNATNLLYTLSGSVASVNQQYWIENATDLKNGTWQDVSTNSRRRREEVWLEWDFFAKDDFKVTKHLTLNLGVRYEAYKSPWIRSGLTSAAVNNGNGLFGNSLPLNGSNFDAWGAPGNLYLTNYGSNGTAVPSGASPLLCTPGVQQSTLLPLSTCDPNRITLIEFVGPNSPNPSKTAIPNRAGVGPAVGFAWQVPWFGEGKTQVRGGFQITYQAGTPGNPALDTLLANSPGSTLSQNTTVTDFNSTLATRALDLTDISALVPVRPTRSPGQALPVFGRSVAYEAYAPDYASPYAENFTLSITRNVRKNVTLDVKYIGTLAKKQAGSLNLNTNNVYAKSPDGSFLNQELYDALVTTRAGGDAPLFDQMLAGLNLNVGATCPNSTATNCYGPIGSITNGQVQHGSAQLRRNTTFATNLANGNFSAVVNSLIALAPTTGQGAQALPIDPSTGTAVAAAQTALRNGCDRIANGLMNTYAAQGIISRCFPENYFVANPQLTTATYDTNLGHTNYQSLQVQSTIRASQGISFQVTGTWAKNMSLSASSYNNPWDRNDDYSYAINSVKKELRGNGTFELPLGPNKLLFSNSSGWFARAIERWQTSIIFNMAAGLPRTVDAFQMQYAAAGGNGSQPRPDVVGPWVTPEMKAVWPDGANQGYYFGSPSPYVSFKDPQCTNNVGATDSLGLNLQANCTLTGLALIVPAGTAGAVVTKTDANGNATQYGLPLLQNPLPGHQGNLGAYTIHTIGRASLDANISKSFRISESKSIQIRIDSRNILNHPLMADPTGVGNTLSLTDNFGAITSKNSGTPRTFQGQVRITF